MVWTLQREPGFGELRYRSHEICFVADFARETADQELLANQLARALECHPARGQAALANGFEQPKSLCRHSAFDGESEGEILTWIKAQAEKSRPVTRIDLRYYCQAKYSRPVTQGRVESFILRHGNGVTEMTSIPQKDTKLEVPYAFLDETTSCLREYVQGMKAGSRFNLDEVGIWEWEDRKDNKLLVPKIIDNQMIHHRASRNVKHISIITCISAGGESLTSYIVASQDSEPLCRRLMSRGVRMGLDIVCDNDRNRTSAVSFSWSTSIVSSPLTLTSSRSRKNSQDAKPCF
jgi:hypothetical protein